MGFMLPLAVLWMIWVVPTGILAIRKNRNFLPCFMAGGVFGALALVYLAFQPFQCPKCRRAMSNEEWREQQSKGHCRNCEPPAPPNKLIKCSCGSDIAVQLSQAGSTTTCLQCDSQVEVPSRRTLASCPDA